MKDLVFGSPNDSLAPGWVNPWPKCEGMGWSFSGITAQSATFWLFRELIPVTSLAADYVYNQCACLPRVSVHSSFVGHIPIVIPSKFLFR